MIYLMHYFYMKLDLILVHFLGYKDIEYETQTFIKVTKGFDKITIFDNERSQKTLIKLKRLKQIKGKKVQKR